MENEKESVVLGYVRKSKGGKALNVSLITKEINARNTETFQSSENGEMVGCVINLKHLEAVLNGEKDFAVISQIKN